MKQTDCPLCSAQQEDCIVHLKPLRIIFINEANYPCFVRVVWNAHICELSDLLHADRAVLIDTVNCVEQCMRQVLVPHKINHASFGNMVSHLHWHIIPRWKDDTHWPHPIWGLQQRKGVAHAAEKKSALAAAIRSEVANIFPYGQALPQ